jgi:hypothetical protein
MKRSVTKLTDKQIYNSLHKWFAESTAQEREDGKLWYKEAQMFTKYVAEEYGIDSYRVAGVVSALSPNNKWERNKYDAITVIKAHLAGLSPKDIKVCTYNANKIKAFEILRGDTEITAKSPKTHSFAMNVGLNSPEHITIDKWHLRACVTTPKDGIVDCMESCTSVQYRRIEALTANVAKSLGYKGYELQAIVWVTIKRVWDR